MMRLFAQFISIMMHPIFVPTYAILFLVKANPYFLNNVSTVLLLMVVNSIFFPLVAILLMRLLGFIDNFSFQDRDKRLTILIPTIVCFSWTFSIFFRNSFHPVLAQVLLGPCFALALAFFFTAIRQTISLHALGMGGLVSVAVWAIDFARTEVSWLIMAIVVVAGLVGTCRLLLKAHTPYQIYLGYLVGFCCQNLAFWIFS